MRIKALSALLAPVLAFGIAACDVDQTEQGELPDVDVQGGQLPEYDVDPADVDVGTDTQQVIIPDVDVRGDTADTLVVDTTRS